MVCMYTMSHIIAAVLLYTWVACMCASYSRYLGQGTLYNGGLKFNCITDESIASHVEVAMKFVVDRCMWWLANMHVVYACNWLWIMLLQAYHQYCMYELSATLQWNCIWVLCKRECAIICYCRGAWHACTFVCYCSIGDAHGVDTTARCILVVKNCCNVIRDGTRSFPDDRHAFVENAARQMVD